MLVGLLTSKRNMPKVIATDRDPSLMKVVAKPISPYSKHHFHSLHLQKPKKCEILGQNPHSKSLQIVRKQVSMLIKHQISGSAQVNLRRS